MKYHYQLVRGYGRYDFEYTIYQARVTPKGKLEIANIPLVLVGNTPDEIKDTLKHIEEDMKTFVPVDKKDCGIFDDTITNGFGESEDTDYAVDPDFDDIDEQDTRGNLDEYREDE